MNLSDLATKLEISINEPDFRVSGVTSDSRRARSGMLFFLLPRADLKYAEQAREQGALVMHSKDIDFGVRVLDIERAFTTTLQALYSESFHGLKIYGVTGTNGKTSFSYMLKALLESYEVPTGIYGTIENRFKDNVLDTGLTSPVAEDFYKFNDENYKSGMKAVVCEVSSHALDQKRLGLDFLSGAAFTSFSQDHLDYHGDMEEYLKAKMKITTESLLKEGFVVGHKSVKEFTSFNADKKIIVGDLNYSFNILNSSIEGIRMSFSKGDESIEGVLPLIGSFNVENFSLALTCLCEHFGSDFFPDQRVFESFKQIPGRMERIDIGNNSLAFIDFSHTPDSLKKSIQTLNEYKKEGQKLIVVFGCGGDRDKTKRPLMGSIATELADEVILTSDNPRFESPEEIIKDISSGLASDNFEVIENRGGAIKIALDRSLTQSVLILIAGKGHESYQEIKGVKSVFSDQRQVHNWLASF